MYQQKRLSKLVNYQNTKVNRSPGKKYNPNQIIRNTIRLYYRNQNWEGLLKYLLLLEERKQLPHSWRWQIGQLYIYNKEAKKGLDYLYTLHYQEPYHPDIQLTIFEALRSLGKSEHSFNWIKKPDIKEIDKNILLTCYTIIQQKKNAVALFILYSMLQSEQCKNFDEFDLLFALKKDSRFYIFNDTCFFRFSRIDIKVEILKYIA